MLQYVVTRLFVVLPIGFVWIALATVQSNAEAA
jgi:hypothetical protein